MNHVIAGLIELENRVKGIYELAAVKFADDPGLQNFFIEMVRSEREHCDILARALYFTKTRPDIASVVTLGEKAKERIERELYMLEAAVTGESASKDAVMGAVVVMEALEWNEIFIYVMNALKKYSSEFIEAAKKIQSHKEQIEAFISSRPEFLKHLAAIRKLPSAWEENILVVDESGTIADILDALFPSAIVRALDGPSAIKKIKDSFFAAVVCDVDMARMNGIEFYRLASEAAPNLRERLLFFSDCTNKEHLDFFKAKNLRVLKKPASVSEIKKMVSAHLQKS